ncbi:MAG: TonB-dependent receptor [Pseudomonadota bacterium]|nr:TonB-dependent receptor [Pseudomonadota bacterium]
MKILKRFLVVIALAIIAPISAIAESIETIIVTATRSSIPTKNATVPVTIIDREQIELSLAKDLSQILRFEAGLDIGRNGGPGQATSLFLRGTESNHTLVLVDGVRINPGTIGGAAFQNINPKIIERIEIVKGARSALYGTDAIGGVINIITKKINSDFINTSVGFGSYNNKTALFEMGYNNKITEFGVTVNSNKTDGYQIRSDSDIKRGYENLTTNFYIKRNIQDNELTLRHFRANGKIEYLDFMLSPLDQDFINESLAIEFNSNSDSQINSKILISSIKDDIKQNQSTDYVYSKRNVFDGQVTYNTEYHNIIAGLYVSDEEASSYAWGSGFNEDTRSNAIFLQDSISEGKHRVFIAARYIDHVTFGNEMLWNAEYGFDINDRIAINGSTGHAYRAPDATDRYGYGGNIHLLPETSDDIQLNVEYRIDSNTSYRLELFNTKINNLIEYDYYSDKMLNIGKASMRGMQIGYKLNHEKYSIRADYINQRAKNDIDKNDLLRRPKQSITINIARELNQHRLGLSILASEKRKDFGVILPGYAIVNLTGQFTISQNTTINAQIENLLNKKYETAENYKMQGRSVFFDITHNWQ